MTYESAPMTEPSRLRCAVYTRYSSDMQRPASLEDQERNCRKYAEEKGWEVIDEFIHSDAAKSGRTMVRREGLKDLQAEAKEKPRPFDVLLCDETSRLGRSLQDVLGIVAKLTHYGVKGMIQQYTDPVLHFSGVLLLVQPDMPDSVETYLENLLRADSNLLHCPLSAGDWVDKAEGSLSQGVTPRKLVTANHLASQFSERAEFYEKRFGLNRIAWGWGHWYIFSKVPDAMSSECGEPFLAAA